MTRPKSSPAAGQQADAESAERKPCYVDGCEREAILRAAGHKVCRGHWDRYRRSGEFGLAAFRRARKSVEVCRIVGCDNPDEGLAGLCPKHATRMRRHGDPEAFIAPENRNILRGEKHPGWAGDGIKTYDGLHARLRSTLGPASNRDCVDCGAEARHWSYDHCDPDERIGLAGQKYAVAYSVKPEHYHPRCVPCHKRFDLEQRSARCGDE